MKFTKLKILLPLVLVYIGYVHSVFGQQDPQYTQYTYNMGILNPAYISTNEVLSVGLLTRTQWVGIDGAPNTSTFTMSGPAGRNVGLGLSVIHDEAGPVIENNLYIDFSYTLNLSRSAKLGLGLKGGMTFLDVELLRPDDLADPLNILVSEKKPNFGVGAFYYTDRFYFGAAIPNFLKTKHLEIGDGVISSSAEVSHIFINSGLVFDLNDRLKFKPSTMVKVAGGAPISLDLSANLLIEETLELGLSYRLEDSVSAIVGFNITQDFRVGYAYDYTLSAFRNYNSGSHEIMLSYKFNRNKFKSPRFF